MTVFLDTTDIGILVDLMSDRATINPDVCINSLKIEKGQMESSAH